MTLTENCSLEFTKEASSLGFASTAHLGTFAHSGDGGSDEPLGTENDSCSINGALTAAQRFKCTSSCTELFN